MSGEHGDGRLRGPLLERYFGPELMRAFGEIKALFDPAGVLNPGNIVAPGPIESMTETLRVRPHDVDIVWPDVYTYFDYEDQEGFAGAVDMCSGAGVCRKTAGGAMCPSYRATMDERHSTRGRANALRLAISGQLPEQPAAKPAWDDPETMATLALCLSCKACKTECPSNVDVARLKAEYLAQSYRASSRIPRAARMFGHVRKLNALGAVMPGLANWIGRRGIVRAIMNRMLGLAPQRSLPPFAQSLYRWFKKRPSANGATTKPRVVLYADCFVTYSEPRIGRIAVNLLENLGYRVELPQVGCCGRSMISTGLLGDAIKSADAVLTTLRSAIDDPAVKAILVCEPSCLSAMKDDWLQLKLTTPLDVRRRLAAKALLVEDFVEKFWAQHPVPPQVREASGHDHPVVMHGHCHQKSLWGEQTSAALLQRLLGAKLSVLPSGCCGMAGAFGYMQDKYELSRQIAAQSLSALKTAPTDAVVVAPGTSCRHQIRDTTGRAAIHPIELAAQLLGVNDPPS